MKYQLHGVFGEVFELQSSLDGAEDESAPIVTDEALLSLYVQDLLESPINRELLRRLALEDPLLAGFGESMSDLELSELAVRSFSSGVLRLTAAPEGPTAWRAFTQQPAPVQPPPQAPRQPVREEPKIRDWKIECHHHTSKGRAFIERGTYIDVVPDLGKTKDSVKVHWRDDYIGALPASLTVRTAGKPEAQANRAGGGGGYTAYGYEVEYLGDRNIQNIISPLFWRAYLEKTTYSFAPGPASINVNVFNPRRFKFEFKLPPMAGIKGGSKYEAQGAQQIRALANKGTLKERVTTEDAYWTPSSLTLKTSRTDSAPGPNFKPRESEQKLADTIQLTRDSALVPDLNYLQLVGSIIQYADTMRRIVEMVKDYAPKVGWYIDWNLQLMQGGLAVEWYWKEHTDHRVFQYIDFNIQLTLFSLTFELGIGVSACSFKLQIYAQLSGELAIEAGAKHDTPDGGVGVQLPTVKGKIAGALGARAEAGYLFKFEAKGETAIEAELGMGINQGRGKMVNVDARARWTGIKCRATFSTGFLGISHNKTENWQPIAESPWWGLTWPEEKNYVPPTITRDRVASTVEAVLYRGWNVRVFDGDRQLELGRVAGMIADRIERDRAFDKTQKAVDAIANSIREDLDVIGDRNWGRDYVTLADLNSYLNGSVRGRSIAPHLAAYPSPTRQLIAANS